MMQKESVKVLNECIDLQLKKSQDYQNPNSNVVQAMHYRRGVDSIHDIMQGKMYRAQSLLESRRGDAANFESLEDTYKDLINYASFAVAWLRGGIEGQTPDRDMFNNKIENN
jgi:Nucleotide modification associated domain 1